MSVGRKLTAAIYLNRKPQMNTPVLKRFLLDVLNVGITCNSNLCEREQFSWITREKL